MLSYEQMAEISAQLDTTRGITLVKSIQDAPQKQVFPNDPEDFSLNDFREYFMEKGRKWGNPAYITIALGRKILTEVFSFGISKTELKQVIDYLFSARQKKFDKAKLTIFLLKSSWLNYFLKEIHPDYEKQEWGTPVGNFSKIGEW